MIEKINVPIEALDSEMKLYPIRCSHCHALLLRANLIKAVLEIKCRCGGFTSVMKGKDF